MSNDASVFRSRERPSDAESGKASGAMTSENVREAISLVKTGSIYELGTRRFHGMPVAAVHPAFQVLSYRTPHGLALQNDQDWLDVKHNSVGFSFQSELVMGSMHSGTHIDAMAHVTTGEDHTWHGGFTADRDAGDFGPRKGDASQLLPLVTTGLLLDVAGAKKTQVLPKGYSITVEDLETASRFGNVRVEPGCAVLIRTGYASLWPLLSAMQEHYGAGITLDSAKWLAQRGAILIGADTEGVERLPSPDQQNPHPVHCYLIFHEGIYVLELADLERLARDRVYKFAFIAAPARIEGATAALVDPLALV